MNNAPNVRKEVAAEQALAYLAACATVSPEATAWAAHAFLQDRSPGLPLITESAEHAREDALFWSETARPEELECYLLAAARRLEENKSLFHGRHIKRLIAALWRSMSPQEQDAFRAYINQGRKNV